MSWLVFGVFGIVAILIIAQVYFGFFHSPKLSPEQTDYPEKVMIHGDTAMNAVYQGKVKMHVLNNDAERFDSAAAWENYVRFLEESSLFHKITEIKESNYRG